jgi:hypothetical protein
MCLTLVSMNLDLSIVGGSRRILSSRWATECRLWQAVSLSSFQITLPVLFVTPHNSITFVPFSVPMTPEFPWWSTPVNPNYAKNALFYLKFQDLI